MNDLLAKKRERDNYDEMRALLELDVVQSRNIEDLSGGELQRFAIAMVCIQKADMYMFDEPSSYLDVKQRLSAARAIRNLLLVDKCVVARSGGRGRGRGDRGQGSV